MDVNCFFNTELLLFLAVLLTTCSCAVICRVKFGVPLANTLVAGKLPEALVVCMCWWCAVNLSYLFTELITECFIHVVAVVICHNIRLSFMHVLFQVYFLHTYLGEGQFCHKSPKCYWYLVVDRNYVLGLVVLYFVNNLCLYLLIWNSERCFIWRHHNDEDDDKDVIL